MKRLFLVLMMVTMLGACGESSTDVATHRGGGDGGFIPPDTVIKTGNATYEIYKPGTPVALQSVQTLTTRAPFERAVEAAGTFGYGLDPGAAAVALGRLDDGRDVLVALGALGAASGDAYLFYLRVGGEEHAFPLRASGRGDSGLDVLEVPGKENVGPENMPWYWGDLLDCILEAMMEVLACHHECADCYNQCVFNTLVHLVLCVQFTTT